jgi:LPS export ABC transporter protein LptC
VPKRAIKPTLLVASVIVAAVWTAQYQSTPYVTSKKTAEDVADLAEIYLLDTQIIKFDESGKPRYILNTPTAVQTKTSDTTNFLQPTILMYSDGELKWTINAENGEASDKASKLVLSNNVKLVTTGDTTSLLTEKLEFDTLKQTAFTESSVDVTAKNAKISANELLIDIPKGKYTLSNRVIADYAPKN